MIDIYTILLNLLSHSDLNSQSSVEGHVENLFILRFFAAAACLNWLIIHLDNTSGKTLIFPGIYHANTLRLNFRHFNITILMSTMQFLQEEVVLFIMVTTV